MTLNEYESERGFDEGTFDKYGIRMEDDVVIIPTLGRNGPWYEREHRPHGKPKYLSPTGMGHHLYNPLGLGPNSGEVWIAEGEFDTIALLAVGAPAVGILGTQAFRREWRHMFLRRIILAFDADDAGEAATIKMAQLWDGNDDVDLSVFKPEHPHTDMNDWFKADRAGFRRAVLEW